MIGLKKTKDMNFPTCIPSLLLDDEGLIDEDGETRFVPDFDYMEMYERECNPESQVRSLKPTASHKT